MVHGWNSMHHLHILETIVRIDNHLEHSAIDVPAVLLAKAS